jgi:aryl-alcohol dehydrogenase-like predicted oxidoreductase
LQGYDWLKESVITPQNIEKVKKLQMIAKDIGCTLAQLALAWCLKNPNVNTVITGASQPEQVDENMKALEVVSQLDPGIIDRIEQVFGNKPEIDDS